MADKVVSIKGDGIGPEVMSSVQQVIAETGANIDWIECFAGLSAIENGHSSTLPDETLKSIEECCVALKGPCTTPVGDGFTSVNVALRKNLDLYGAVRPVRNIKGIGTNYDDVDLIVVRENTEGLYSGIENEISDGVITSLKVVTEKACRRIAQFAIDLAISRNRKRISVFHKANIMKLGDGLFIRCAREEFEKRAIPGLEYEELIIDAACMRLVQDPKQFDIILVENLYGDVLSDLCAGMVGGLGVVPGANFGLNNAIFEAVHGSAPDISGRNIANPLAMIMSGVAMLRYLASLHDNDFYNTVADKIKNAYSLCLQEGLCTRDIGGNLGTKEFTDMICHYINNA